MMETNKIFEWIAVLKARPEMIIAEPMVSYQVLKNYIEGYIDGIGQTCNKNLVKNISQWYLTKINVESAVPWTSYIPFRYKTKTDAELKALLLEITESYFRENPDWYK